MPSPPPTTWKTSCRCLRRRCCGGPRRRVADQVPTPGPDSLKQPNPDIAKNRRPNQAALPPPLAQEQFSATRGRLGRHHLPGVSRPRRRLDFAGGFGVVRERDVFRRSALERSAVRAAHRWPAGRASGAGHAGSRTPDDRVGDGSPPVGGGRRRPPRRGRREQRYLCGRSPPGCPAAARDTVAEAASAGTSRGAGCRSSSRKSTRWR